MLLQHFILYCSQGLQFSGFFISRETGNGKSQKIPGISREIPGKSRYFFVPGKFPEKSGISREFPSREIPGTNPNDQPTPHWKPVENTEICTRREEQGSNFSAKVQDDDKTSPFLFGYFYYYYCCELHCQKNINLFKHQHPVVQLTVVGKWEAYQIS